MLRRGSVVAISLAILGAASAWGREACQERTLDFRYAPQAENAHNWCWAAGGQMVMELLGEGPTEVCQCRQAEEVLGIEGCCSGSGSCVPADQMPPRCDKPRWPAFVEKSSRYGFEYRTTCDGLAEGIADEDCDAMALGWYELTAEICKGRPVLAALRRGVVDVGHLVVVKGISTHGGPRVLIVDPAGVCPAGRECEGELDEAFWISYEEYAAGWGGLAHWVDFYGLRRR